jgi:anti-sigma B factor antagonist
MTTEGEAPGFEAEGAVESGSRTRVVATATRHLGSMPVDPLQIDVDHDGRGVVVRVTGELDHAAEEQLAACVDQVLAMAPGGALTLDGADITFIDSSGIRALLIADRRCREAGASFVLRAPSEQLLRVLELGGVTQALTIDA